MQERYEERLSIGEVSVEGRDKIFGTINHKYKLSPRIDVGNSGLKSPGLKNLINKKGKPKRASGALRAKNVKLASLRQSVDVAGKPLKSLLKSNEDSDFQSMRRSVALPAPRIQNEFMIKSFDSA